MLVPSSLCLLKARPVSHHPDVIFLLVTAAWRALVHMKELRLGDMCIRRSGVEIEVPRARGDSSSRVGRISRYLADTECVYR